MCFRYSFQCTSFFFNSCWIFFLLTNFSLTSDQVASNLMDAEMEIFISYGDKGNEVFPLISYFVHYKN